MTFLAFLIKYNNFFLFPSKTIVIHPSTAQRSGSNINSALGSQKYLQIFIFYKLITHLTLIIGLIKNVLYTFLMKGRFINFVDKKGGVGQTIVNDTKYISLSCRLVNDGSQKSCQRSS